MTDSNPRRATPATTTTVSSGIPPRYVLSSGVRIATYSHDPIPEAELPVSSRASVRVGHDGPTDRANGVPTVVAVHGFASNATLNWDVAGWTRALTRAGFRLITFDQRAHGASDKPHDPREYGIDTLVDDLIAVLDAYDLPAAHILGYSLGARVAWRLGVRHPDRVLTLSLGGLPEGDPLTAFDLDAARAHLRLGTPVTERLTAAYLAMAEGVPGNDSAALVSLVEGMRGGEQPTTADTPAAPALFVCGDRDAVAEGSRRLASATPGAEFVSLPGRNHLNAVSSRAFKDAVLEFLVRRRD